MATLPDVAGSSRAPTPQPAGGVASFEPVNWRQVGMVGGILSSAGADVDRASRIVEQTNDQQDAITARAAANQLDQARVAAEFDPQSGFRNAKEGQAVGKPFVDAYTQRWQQSIQSIRDGLQNDNQRRMFDQHADVQGLQFRQALLQHQSIETDKFNDATDDNTIKLALQEAATRPTDELSFQTQLAKINGTVDAFTQRKGLPKAASDQLRSTYFDAAYTSRISSIMHGIPGAVDSDPYTAEKMFMQVRDQLQPHTQVTLGYQVQQAVKQVQQRDIAHALVYGHSVTDPRSLYSAIGDSKPLAAVIQDNESGGKRFDAAGNLLTSDKGAQGEMQVLPETARNPGFGVTPAKDDSPEELARVGRDYVGAMTARYQDPALVLAAYNAGPGQVDKWIAQYGDPRTGTISRDEWLQKVPFAETRDYVTKGLAKLGSASESPSGAPMATLTAREMKTQLPALVQQAQQLWTRMYPNDPMGADAVGARVAAYGNQVLAGVTAQEQGAQDTVTRMLVGGAKTIDDITGTAEGRTAWQSLTPETQLRVMDRLKQGDQKLDQQGFNIYYAMLGKAGNDPEGFVGEDLSKLYGQIPDHLLLQLSTMQKSVASRDIKQQQKDLAWNRSRTEIADIVNAAGLDQHAKPGTPKADALNRFYGQYLEAMQNWHDQNGNKWPDTKQSRTLASGLLAQGKERVDSSFLPDSSKRFYEADQSKFYVPLPSPSSTEYKNLAQQFRSAMGRDPQGSELQEMYTKYRLSGGK